MLSHVCYVESKDLQNVPSRKYGKDNNLIAMFFPKKKNIIGRIQILIMILNLYYESKGEIANECESINQFHLGDFKYSIFHCFHFSEHK